MIALKLNKSYSCTAFLLHCIVLYCIALSGKDNTFQGIFMLCLPSLQVTHFDIPDRLIDAGSAPFKRQSGHVVLIKFELYKGRVIRGELQGASYKG